MITKLAALLEPGDVDNLPTDTAESIVTNGLDVVYYIAGAISVIVIIASGIIYMTASGDQNKITMARQALQYSLVGLVVVALAFTITQFVIGRF